MFVRSWRDCIHLKRKRCPILQSKVLCCSQYVWYDGLVLLRIWWLESLLWKLHLGKVTTFCQINLYSFMCVVMFLCEKKFGGVCVCENVRQHSPAWSRTFHIPSPTSGTTHQVPHAPRNQINTVWQKQWDLSCCKLPDHPWLHRLLYLISLFIPFWSPLDSDWPSWNVFPTYTRKFYQFRAKCNEIIFSFFRRLTEQLRLVPNLYVFLYTEVVPWCCTTNRRGLSLCI